MLLELYGMEETNRLRQSTIAHDVEVYRLKTDPGFMRRVVGSMLVRLGESMRGSTTRQIVQPIPVVAASR